MIGQPFQKSLRDTIHLASGDQWQLILQKHYHRSLHGLSIFSCQIDDEKLQQLQSYSWVNVKQLELYWNEISKKGMSRLLFKNTFPNLSYLHLEYISINDQQFETLLSKYHLVYLNLSYSSLTNSSIKFLMLNCSDIVYLNLDSNFIGSKGIKMLVKANLSSLQNLSLQKNEIGNEGMVHLSKGNWPCLKALDLSLQNVNINTALAFSQSNWVSFEKLGGTLFDQIPTIPVISLISAKWGQKVQIVRIYYNGRNWNKQMAIIFSSKFIKWKGIDNI